MSEDRSNDQPSDDPQELAALQRELEAARAQLADLEGLLGDLPQMFERKFEQRLEPLLDQQRLIAEENQRLLDQVRHVLGSGDPPGGRPALPAAGEMAPAKAEVPPRQPESQAVRGSPDDPPLTPAPPKAPGSHQRSSPTPVNPLGFSPVLPPVPESQQMWSSHVKANTQKDLGGEQAITVRHWVLPHWLPQRFSVARLRRGAGLLGVSVGVALLAAAAVVGLQRLRPQTASPVVDADAITSPAPLAPASGASSPQVVFNARGVSWLDVQDAKGNQLFWGNLKGERRFPIGAGLKVLAGRPDLVTVRVAGEPPRVLGRIEQVISLPIKAP
ncbi:MAG: RodZ domain-containing protein [Prochlorococcaceae cyanobacterium]